MVLGDFFPERGTPLGSVLGETLGQTPRSLRTNALHFGVGRMPAEPEGQREDAPAQRKGARISRMVERQGAADQTHGFLQPGRIDDGVSCAGARRAEKVCANMLCKELQRPRRFSRWWVRILVMAYPY